MATLAQLQAEPWWSREIVTDELDWLGDELCSRTGRPRDAFGSKGNTAHLSGGHRSQEWLKNSDYCTNRNYTVQSGLTADQLRHIAAFDWTPLGWGTAANHALMVTHTKNLFAAARSGQLTGMRQVFGTLDGRTAIGLNVLTNTLTYPDDSHVEHIHGTFDRRYMRDKALMARLADIITGDDMATINQEDWDNLRWRNYSTDVAGSDTALGGPAVGQKMWLTPFLKAMDATMRAGFAAEATRDAATLAAIQALAAGGSNVDTAAIVNKISAEANATRDLVEQRHAAEMAELSRVHAAQLAEKDAEKAGLQAELDKLNAAGQ